MITVIIIILSILEIAPFYISFERVASVFIPSSPDLHLFEKIFEGFVVITVLYNFLQGYAAYLRAIG